jgi:hypothetical protein
MIYIATYYRLDGEIAQVNLDDYDSQWVNNGNNLTRKEVATPVALRNDIYNTKRQVDDNGLQKYYINASGNIMERENWIQAEEVLP